MPLLLQLHALATIFMAGVIWFVQVVHYPLFRAVGRDVSGDDVPWNEGAWGEEDTRP